MHPNFLMSAHWFSLLCCRKMVGAGASPKRVSEERCGGLLRLPVLREHCKWRVEGGRGKEERYQVRVCFTVLLFFILDILYMGRQTLRTSFGKRSSNI